MAKKCKSRMLKLWIKAFQQSCIKNQNNSKRKYKQMMSTLSVNIYTPIISFQSFYSFLVPRNHIDDEYATAEYREPMILITTSRDPSPRLVNF